jgi:glycosyltransferase involved in cell wall biosynthesis
MRLAVFSPLPPVKSGIADYTVELLAALGARHAVEVFVGSRDEVAAWPPGREAFAVRSAHDFVWAAVRTPFDVVVYQMGNAWCHDYIWPYLFAYPGVVVLHDGHLHHARAWSLLRRKRHAEYRAELAFNHPGLLPEAAEVGLSGFAGPVYYHWPMLRAVIEASRMTLVHNERLAAELADAHRSSRVEAVAMGVAGPVATPAQVAAARYRCGAGPESVLVTAFGGVTPEKRIEPLLRAFAVATRYHPNLRLALVGQLMPHFDATALAEQLGVVDRLVMPGYVSEAELPAFLAASDVIASLRWPSARETSASWLRALAAGRPTIITELAQQVEVPTLDPRSWTVVHAEPTLETPAPIAVGIDILDEQHSLTLALKRLVSDDGLRRRIGDAARGWWTSRHTVGQMASRYEHLLVEAAAIAPPEIELPRHLRPDPGAFAQTLLHAMPGVRLAWQVPESP